MRYSRTDLPSDTGLTGVPLTSSRVLSNLDLNLLVTLDAVLHHGSVTRAAEDLGVSQPAVSAALRRLRRHFGDELLQRVGNRYQLTPLGIELRPRTRLALDGVQRVFSSSAQIDVSDTTREFSIVTSDYAISLLGRALSEALLAEAPHARLRMIPTAPDHVAQAHQILTALDLLLMPHGFIADLPHTDLFRDQWVILVDHAHPAIERGLTLTDLRTSPWVLVYNTQTASTPAARQLRIRGIDPWPQIVTETFLTVPHLVRGSDRIALIPSRLADDPANHHGLAILPCPVDLDPLVQAMWWHPAYDNEPEHQFLRRIVTTATRRIFPEPEPPLDGR